MDDVERDRLADEPAQQHLQFRQHVVELERLRPQRLPAREGEQLPDETRRPVGVLLDLHDVLEGRVGRPVVGEQEVGIADDRGQHVVEVVRDAAGELADRLHLLALGEVLLQGALLGRVEREDDRARALVAGGIRGGEEQPRRARRLRALERDVERLDPGRARAAAASAPRRWAWSRSSTRLKMDGLPPAAFSAPGASRANAALGRNSAPSAATSAMATGVELKMRASRTSAARRSSPPLTSPGARLITSEREGPGAPSLEKATLCRMRAGTTRPWRGLRSTSNCCGRHFARPARHGGEHRASVAGDDVADLELAEPELGEVVVQPFRERRVHVDDRAVRLGREEFPPERGRDSRWRAGGPGRRSRAGRARGSRPTRSRPTRPLVRGRRSAGPGCGTTPRRRRWKEAGRAAGPRSPACRPWRPATGGRPTPTRRASRRTPARPFSALPRRTGRGMRRWRRGCANAGR